MTVNKSFDGQPPTFVAADCQRLPVASYASASGRSCVAAPPPSCICTISGWKVECRNTRPAQNGIFRSGWNRRTLRGDANSADTLPDHLTHTQYRGSAIPVHLQLSDHTDAGISSYASDSSPTLAPAFAPALAPVLAPAFAPAGAARWECAVGACARARVRLARRKGATAAGTTASVAVAVDVVTVDVGATAGTDAGAMGAAAAGVAAARAATAGTAAAGAAGAEVAVVGVAAAGAATRGGSALSTLSTLSVAGAAACCSKAICSRSFRISA